MWHNAGSRSEWRGDPWLQRTANLLQRTNLSNPLLLNTLPLPKFFLPPVPRTTPLLPPCMSPHFQIIIQLWKGQFCSHRVPPRFYSPTFPSQHDILQICWNSCELGFHDIQTRPNPVSLLYTIFSLKCLVFRFCHTWTVQNDHKLLENVFSIYLDLLNSCH